MQRRIRDGSMVSTSSISCVCPCVFVFTYGLWPPVAGRQSGPATVRALQKCRCRAGRLSRLTEQITKKQKWTTLEQACKRLACYFRFYFYFPKQILLLLQHRVLFRKYPRNIGIIALSNFVWNLVTQRATVHKNSTLSNLVTNLNCAIKSLNIFIISGFIRL